MRIFGLAIMDIIKKIWSGPMAINENKEHVVTLDTGCELRTPSYPDPCTYVRVVDPMLPFCPLVLRIPGVRRPEQ